MARSPARLIMTETDRGLSPCLRSQLSFRSNHEVLAVKRFRASVDWNGNRACGNTQLQLFLPVCRLMRKESEGVTKPDHRWPSEWESCQLNTTSYLIDGTSGTIHQPVEGHCYAWHFTIPVKNTHLGIQCIHHPTPIFKTAALISTSNDEGIRNLETF